MGVKREDYQLPRNRIDIETVAPKYAVKSAGDVTDSFDITNISHSQGNKFGGMNATTWRIYCVDNTTGEQFILFFQGNTMRDEVFGQILAVMSKNPDTVFGPCIIESIPLENGQKTYNIGSAKEYPAEPAPTSTRKNAAAGGENKAE